MVEKGKPSLLLGSRKCKGFSPALLGVGGVSGGRLGFFLLSLGISQAGKKGRGYGEVI